MKFLNGNKNKKNLLLVNFITLLLLLITNILVIKNIYGIKVSWFIRGTEILLIGLIYYFCSKIINKDFTNKGFCYLMLSGLLFNIMFAIIAKVTRGLNDKFFLNELYYQWEGMCKGYIIAASFTVAAIVKKNMK